MVGETARKPAFAAGFPSDARLDALVQAFARGDYATVRREAPKLASESDDDAVKRAATELRARIEPDPLGVWMLIATALILLALSGYWVARAHTPPAPPPAASSTAPRAPAPTVTVERVK